MHKLISSLALLSLIVVSSSHAAELHVHIDGLTNNEGKVMIALFDRASDFPRSRAKALALKAAAPEVRGIFTDLAAGRYAVSVYQDENSNGVLDRNLFGKPTERYGFSRDAAGIMGPPEFAEAAVDLAGENKTIVIHLR